MTIILGLVVCVLGPLAATIIYVAILWRLDRYEKEPAGLLALAFTWGALPSVIASIVLELALGGLIGSVTAHPTLANALDDGLLVPLVEESVKGVALLGFLVLFRREFDDVLDGIVYGGMIGFGFAFTETVFYIAGGVLENGLGNGVAILFLRTVIFGANHAFFTGVTGAAIGAARLAQGGLRRVVLPCAGWLLAVAFHGVHNLGVADSTLLASLGVSIVSDWLGILLLLAIVALVWRKERGWLAQELAEEVRLGLLSEREYATLTGAAVRQRALAAIWRGYGRQAYNVARQRQTLFTELAFKKHQLRSLGDEGGNSAEIQRLRQAIGSPRLAWEDGTTTTS